MKYIKNSILVILIVICLAALNYKYIDYYYLYRGINAYTQKYMLGEQDSQIKVWITNIMNEISDSDASYLYQLLKTYANEDIEFFYCTSYEENCLKSHEKDSWYKLTNEEKKALLIAIIRLQVRVGGFDSEHLPYSYKGSIGESDQIVYPTMRRKILFRRKGEIILSLYFDYCDKKSHNENIFNNVVKFFEFENEIPSNYSLQHILTKNWKSFYSYELKKLLRDFVDNRKLESNEIENM